MRSSAWIGALCVALLWCACPLEADPVTLTSGNSVLAMDPYTQKGIYSWEIDGTEVMYQQWFWFRAGSDTREYAVDDINLDATVTTAGSRARATYLDQDFQISIRFTLTGGDPGSNISDLWEHISITNNSAESLPFTFFQYSNLGFSQGHDTVQFTSEGTVRQSGLTNGMFFIDETVVDTDDLVHHEAGVYPFTLNRLNDSSVTALNDSNSAAGNVTWAFQWERVLAPGASMLIDKNISVWDPVVPEPGAIYLLAGCVGWYLVAHRLRTKKSLKI